MTQFSKQIGKMGVPVVLVIHNRSCPTHQKFKSFVYSWEIISPSFNTEYKFKKRGHNATASTQNQYKILQFILFVNVFKSLNKNNQVVIDFYLPDGFQESDKSMGIRSLERLVIVLWSEFLEMIIRL